MRQMTDALIYRPFDRTIYRESREVVSNPHLPLTFGEVAEYRRPSLWPFVKVAFVGIGLVALAVALIIWSF